MLLFPLLLFYFPYSYSFPLLSFCGTQMLWLELQLLCWTMGTRATLGLVEQTARREQVSVFLQLTKTILAALDYKSSGCSYVTEK